MIDLSYQMIALLVYYKLTPSLAPFLHSFYERKDENKRNGEGIYEFWAENKIWSVQNEGHLVRNKWL